jgi:hypothetical protein
MVSPYPSAEAVEAEPIKLAVNTKKAIFLGMAGLVVGKG